MEPKIIVKLLDILSHTFNDGVYREVELFPIVRPNRDFSLIRLVIKGERDKGTPFYCGSVQTCVIQEDYCEGELVYASVLYTETDK